MSRPNVTHELDRVYSDCVSFGGVIDKLQGPEQVYGESPIRGEAEMSKSTILPGIITDANFAILMDYMDRTVARVWRGRQWIRGSTPRSKRRVDMLRRPGLRHFPEVFE